MLDRLHALETFGIKLGLENISRLCAALGHPERSFRTIHVAGTNGKGSVTAFTHAALNAAGIRAARYTSPHLVELRERFVVGDTPVPAAALDDAGRLVMDTIDRLVAEGTLALPPTFFEATTAIGFELFRRADVEVGVIEVGLGGRFDATNVIDARIGAITSIALDHQAQLGSTIGAIAFEKGGIIKPGMTVVTGALPAEASTVLADIARANGASIHRADAEARADATFEDGRAVVTIRTARGNYGPLPLALRGQHQIANALVAVRLLEAAADAGVPLSSQAIAAGLATAVWPARLEVIALRSGQRVLLDAAHNPEGAAALAAYLAAWHPERPPLVIGVMADKDVDGILAALLPVTSRIIATAARFSRALPADRLAERVATLDPSRPVDVITPANDAVTAALRTGAGLACIAGSIYLVGEVRDALEQHAILQ